MHDVRALPSPKSQLKKRLKKTFLAFYGFQGTLLLTPYKGIRIYGIRQIFACGNPGVLDFGIGNTAQGIQNPVRIEKQNPNSAEKDWNPVAGIRNSLRGVQHSLGFPYMGQLPLVEKITIFLASRQIVQSDCFKTALMLPTFITIVAIRPGADILGL